jgi:hypothetical protein
MALLNAWHCSFSVIRQLKMAFETTRLNYKTVRRIAPGSNSYG